VARALQTFVITAVDGRGQPRRTGGDVFHVKVDRRTAPAAGDAAATKGGAKTDAAELLPVAVAVRDAHDGTYAVSYDGTQAGAYIISVTDANGQPLPRSPFHVTIKPGAARRGAARRVHPLRPRH